VKKISSLKLPGNEDNNFEFILQTQG